MSEEQVPHRRDCEFTQRKHLGLIIGVRVDDGSCAVRRVGDQVSVPGQPADAPQARRKLRHVARRQVAAGLDVARETAESKSRLVRIAVPLISRMMSPGWKPTLRAIVRAGTL